MEFELYTIYDSATQSYSVPMAQMNDAEAMRSFAHECMKPDTMWHTHPQDFIMYKIGTFYALTGEIIASSPERICSATDFVKKRGINNGN